MKHQRTIPLLEAVWEASKPLGRAGLKKRPFFLRTEMDRLLAISMLFSCLLVVARIMHTGRMTFITLIWNLFLAYIPYFITECLRYKPATRAHKLSFGVLFTLWLLFVPNSFYIITDLFHLADRWNDRQAPMWFDLTMILSFAWNGLLLGVLSVRQMERLLLPDATLRNELFFLYPVMWLNALGVYIGRYLRYNSWDVVSNPFDLLGDIVRMIIHPLRHQYAWDMILCFSILMTLMYVMLRRISKALNS